MGECYLGLSKLIQAELREYDKRESMILQSKISLGMKKPRIHAG